MGTCGSVGEAKRGSRVMFRFLRKRGWRIERMAAGVLREAERLERRENGESKEGGQTRHGFALDFAYTFIFRDEVVEFLLWIRNATDLVLFCEKVARWGDRLARQEELEFIFCLFS